MKNILFVALALAFAAGSARAHGGGHGGGGGGHAGGGGFVGGGHAGGGGHGGGGFSGGGHGGFSGGGASSGFAGVLHSAGRSGGGYARSSPVSGVRYAPRGTGSGVMAQTRVGARAALGAVAFRESGGFYQGFRPMVAPRFTASRGRAAADDSPPPNFSKPGALIRTAGQLPVYSDPGPAGNNAGPTNAIALDSSRAQNVGGRGVSWGAPDRAPSAGGSGAGGGGASSNGASAFDPSF